jgi:hypothetical protein
MRSANMKEREKIKTALGIKTRNEKTFASFASSRDDKMKVVQKQKMNYAGR